MGLCCVQVAMPQAIASHKDLPIFENVLRLKINMHKPVNYMHARAVCTRLFFLRRPLKEPEDEAYSSTVLPL